MGARWRAWLLGCANGLGRRPGGKKRARGELGWLGLSASRPPGRVRLIFLFFFFFILFPKPFQKRFSLQTNSKQGNQHKIKHAPA